MYIDDRRNRRQQNHDVTRHCLFHNLDTISNSTLNKLTVTAENLLREQGRTTKENQSPQIRILSKAPLVLFPINIWSTIGGYLKLDTLTNTLTLVNRDLYRNSNCLAMYKDRSDLKLQLDEKRLEAIHNGKHDLFIVSKCNTLQFCDCEIYDRKYLDYFTNILNWSLSSDYYSKWLVLCLQNITILDVEGLGLAYLSLIPINLLFDKLHCKLKELTMKQFGWTPHSDFKEQIVAPVSNFMIEYSKYFQQICQNDLSKINNLQHVSILCPGDPINIVEKINLFENYQSLSFCLRGLYDSKYWTKNRFVIFFILVFGRCILTVVYCHHGCNIIWMT